MATQQRIVVGVEGSGGARAALRWAIEEARHRDAVIEVVTAYAPTYVPAAPDLGYVPLDPINLVSEVERMQADVVGRRAWKLQRIRSNGQPQDDQGTRRRHTHQGRRGRRNARGGKPGTRRLPRPPAWLSQSTDRATCQLSRGYRSSRPRRLALGTAGVELDEYEALVKSFGQPLFRRFQRGV